MLTRWPDFGLTELDRSFSALNELRREMDRLFGARGSVDVAGHRSAGTRWSIRDTGAELRLNAELPGFTEKDLELTLERGTLTLRGERKHDAPEGYSVHRKERGTLRFARSFTLPCKIDAEKVVASLKDGVLDVRLPKAAEEQPRAISVRAA